MIEGAYRFSGSMGALVPIRTVNGALFMREFRALAPPGKK